MSDIVGSRDFRPFKVYAKGEPWPLDGFVDSDGAVVYGCCRWAPVNDDGTVTITAEALRDLCNHVYREGWRFGEMSTRSTAPIEMPVATAGRTR